MQTSTLARGSLAAPRLDGRRIRRHAHGRNAFAVQAKDSDLDKSEPLSAVIVGGGIGGLAAAIALRRIGVDAQVYERATALRSNAGTGIAIWPNGVKALRVIGDDVADEVASRGCEITGMRMGMVDEPSANAPTSSNEENGIGGALKKAVAKLVKDRAELLAFYDFPAEHWKHIRTTNPIESVFATVRNRTRKTKGCLNRKTALAMVYRLMMSAKKKWRKISGPNRLPEVIQGVEFKDGIKQLQNAA